MCYRTVLLFRKQKSVKVILVWGLKIFCLPSVHARQVRQITFFDIFIVRKVNSAHNWEVIIIFFQNQTLGSVAAVQKPSHEQESRKQRAFCVRGAAVGKHHGKMGHWGEHITSKSLSQHLCINLRLMF